MRGEGLGEDVGVVTRREEFISDARSGHRLCRREGGGIEGEEVLQALEEFLFGELEDSVEPLAQMGLVESLEDAFWRALGSFESDIVRGQDVCSKTLQFGQGKTCFFKGSEERVGADEPLDDRIEGFVFLVDPVEKVEGIDRVFRGGGRRRGRRIDNVVDGRRRRVLGVSKVDELEVDGGKVTKLRSVEERRASTKRRGG
mmetsp:Transcript_2148/g.3790  ORF Transcript_2148/g.3790 Transcript_2148/m.3790 type:complete len:200 (+) Transcript_2148:150-749(+)